MLIWISRKDLIRLMVEFLVFEFINIYENYKKKIMLLIFVGNMRYFKFLSLIRMYFLNIRGLGVTE